MIWSCTIPGTPVAKGRPRFTMRANQARAYTPGRTREWENMAAMLMASQWRREPLAGPVSVELLVLLHRPQRLMRASDPDGRVMAPVKPDLDNFAKAAKDALQLAKVVNDDSQVVDLVARKRYHAKDEGPGVMVSVEPLDAPHSHDVGV